eukprot:TRINITY_DN8049_c0_g1_i1.p3 TRINITY_DN8049_c0_g1~~TRINITY_DN8049_c0_g1_i1.p3  ORF type:complete len:139 (+),score=64.40 TRINITY_DN8049_c0_g1_i1:217-633(+)
MSYERVGGEDEFTVEQYGSYVEAAKARREAERRKRLLAEGAELEEVIDLEAQRKREREERRRRAVEAPSPGWCACCGSVQSRVGGALERGKSNAKVCCVCCGTGGCGVLVCGCVLFWMVLTFVVGWILAHKWELIAAA